ncbi:hypothetical protein RJ55_03819 [Drechmeria coniospora]|nr:hypothetical protein RJ55_03819 [Drechmeria coniospora]
MSICLFVDGLEEFDGDHLALTHFFKNIGLGEHGKGVKICPSSRQWAVFADAFTDVVPQLRLQDLTYSDMHGYVRHRLRANSDIGRLLERKPEAGDMLIKVAVERSDGVFLWLRLAVDTMMDDFNSLLGISNLFANLERLPSHLDGLFAHLLFEGLTAEQLSVTATIFRLIRAREVVADFLGNYSANSPTVWELAFCLEEDDDDLALSLVVEKVSDDYVRIRDWLMLPDGVGDRLSSALPLGFDPHLRLLRSYILRLKRPLEEVEHHRRLDEWWPDITLAVTHARHIVIDVKSLQLPLLSELDKTLSWLWMCKPQDRYDHWARSAFGAYEVRVKAPPICQPFLCLASKFGLIKYVSEEVIDTCAKEHQSKESCGNNSAAHNGPTPLLAYAVEFLCSRNRTIYPLSNPTLFKVLLEHPSHMNSGANHEYVDFTTRAPTTPWLTLLRHLRDARRRQWIAYYDIDPLGTARWMEIVRLFVEVGAAHPHAVVASDAWDPEISALDVLQLLDQTYGAVEIPKLKEGLRQKLNASPEYPLSIDMMHG